MANPVGPVLYAITVNGAPAQYMQYAFDAELRQSYGCHDLFFIRFEFPRSFPNINHLAVWPQNAAVNITWGRKPDLNTWYGYVNHYEHTSDSDSGLNNQQITYCCIGTSKVLNSDAGRAWNNVSPTYIAKQIAKENHFRSVVTTTNWVLDYEAQTGESPFTFLNRVGDKYGLRFWCSGGTLYMVDPAIAFYSGAKPTAPVFTMDKSLTVQDTLRDFSKMQGDNLPGGTLTNKSIFGIDAASGQLISATAAASSASTTSYVNTNRTVSSYSDAQNVVSAWQGLSQYWIGATAQVFGSTSLYPGKVISFQGGSLPGGADGYWLVTAARHQMRGSGLSLTTLDRYATDLEIMRNTSNASVSLKGVQAISPEFASMHTSGGTWYANSLASIQEGITT